MLINITRKLAVENLYFLFSGSALNPEIQFIFRLAREKAVAALKKKTPTRASDIKTHTIMLN